MSELNGQKCPECNRPRNVEEKARQEGYDEGVEDGLNVTGKITNIVLNVSNKKSLQEEFEDKINWFFGVKKR